MKARKRWVLGVGSLVAALGLAMSGMAGAMETLTIQGSTTVLPIAQSAAEEYMDMGEMGLFDMANITVRGGGSGTGIAALIDGAVDIADASRPMKDKEIAKAREHGINAVEHVVAKDGIAVVVNPANSIDGLSLDQIKAVYTGQISDWQQLGGAAGQIVVISRDTSSGTFETFNELALDDAEVREDALMLGSNRAVATTVASTPGAIGYVGMGYLSDALKALTVEGVEPTQETVVSGEYKLSRPLFMYTNGEPTGLTKNFIQFVLSLAGQRIVEDEGFVPLR